MKKGLLSLLVIAGIAFILVGIAMNFGPTMLGGFEATRQTTSTQTDTFDSPTLTSNVTETLTLTYAPWQGLSGSVDTISSNTTGDSSANVNSLSGRALTIGSLDNSTVPKLITVTYEYGTISGGGYTGFDAVATFGPTLLILGFIIAIGVTGFLGIRMAKKS
jgi:hypothetical protein